MASCPAPVSSVNHLALWAATLCLVARPDHSATLHNCLCFHLFCAWLAGLCAGAALVRDGGRRSAIGLPARLGSLDACSERCRGGRVGPPRHAAVMSMLAAVIDEIQVSQYV